MAFPPAWRIFYYVIVSCKRPIELIDKDIRAVALADPVQRALIRYENGCGMCGLTKSTPLRQRLLKSNVSKTELKLNN